MQGESTAAMSNNAPNNTFKLPKSKGLNRPTTWFGASSFGSNRTSSSSSSSSGLSSQTITLGGSGLAGSSASGSGSVQPTTTTASRGFSRTSNQAGLSSPSPFASSAHSFQSPFPSSKGKHRLSPSPSPRHTYGEDDFVMISPIRPPPFPSTANPTYANQSFNIGSTSSANSMMRSSSGSASYSSSPAEDSPTPACGVANATARLKLADDDSPIRKVPGQSRSLARGPKDEGRNIFSAAIKQGIRRDVPTSPLKQMTTNTMRSMDDPEEEDNDGSPRLSQMPLGNGPPVPPRQPLFPPLRASQSQDCDGATSKSRSLFHNANQSGTGRRSEESRIPRLSTSHPIRARSSTEVDRPTLGQKKAVSLDAIPISSGSSDEPFGHPIPPASTLGKKSRPSSSTGISGLPGREGRAHKRINSGEYHNLASAAAGSISRSMGQKSGLALSLTPSPAFGTLPDFNHSSNSSLSSLSTNTTNLTPTTSAFSPAEPPIFEDVKPLAEAFEQPAATVSRKFKPRDSGVSMSGDEEPKTKSILIPPPSVMKPNRGFLLAGTGVKPKRPAMLKRTSSMGNDRYERPLETPIMGPGEHTGWPALAYNANTNNANAFDFLGEGAAGLGIGTKGASGDVKPSMPGTPVKKHAYGHSHGGGPFGHHKVGHSMSQPSLNADTFDLGTRAGNEQIMGRLSLGAAGATTSGTLTDSSKVNLAPGRGRRNTLGQSSQIQLPLPPMSVKKPQVISVIPHLTLTSTSSPGSPSPGTVDADMSSPTVRVSSTTLTASSLRSMDSAAPVERVSLLRRLSNGAGSSESEEEGTPTKGGGDRTALGQPVFKTPTPSPGKSHLRHAAAPPSAMRNPASNHSGQGSIMPRLSLPAFANPKVHRTLHHRQSHPATYAVQAEEEDLFEKRFITLEQIGKGAFSTVIKVQDRDGDGLYAVKKARGVFDGVKDRLRHLEEVDILRLLSKTPCKHVIHFEDAWEQNRQLYIQTELCLGSLAFFLEEYGRVVERLDEGRVWKIVRELSDGINHIHSNGVIHFDIKPANILISGTGSLKIGDFGLATRWPRVHPSVILQGSGLGGVVPTDVNMEKLEREGDRVYMPPEMLRGVFVKAADVFSFGLVILEVSTNICVPDGGAPWQALRTNDFTVVDLSPLSPALTDLITSCMHSDPSSRPCIDHIVSHPIVQRARNGKDALAPEDPRWLVDVLSGGSGFGFSGVAAAHDGDIVMAE